MNLVHQTYDLNLSIPMSDVLEIMRTNYSPSKHFPFLCLAPMSQILLLQYPTLLIPELRIFQLSHFSRHILYNIESIHQYLTRSGSCPK